MGAEAEAAAARIRALLDEAAAAGRTLSFWWRDDDATAATADLDRLLALRARASLPLAVAVIPAALDPSLPARLAGEDGVVVLEHGWSHANHEPSSGKAMELGPARPAAAVLAELAAGRARLAAAFGPRFLPVLVPPWNRAAPAVLSGAAGIGLAAVSLHGTRGVPGRVDTHLDPVDWRGGRGFAGAEAAVAPVAAALAAGGGEAGPVGLLTHHLAMDGETWAFLAAFLAVAAGHRAARWPAPAALFGL